MELVNKLKTKIRVTYRNIVRPLRNILLKMYMDKPVMVFAGHPVAIHGGIYMAMDYSGLDNTLKLEPISTDNTAYEVSIYAKPTELFIYSLDKKDYVKNLLLNLLSRTIGRI